MNPKNPQLSQKYKRPRFLDQMTNLTLKRVASAKTKFKIQDLQKQISHQQQPHDVIHRLHNSQTPKIIAEVKRQSPSAGKIAIELDAVDIAKSYATAGASAISVLTEPVYFGGCIGDLKNIRSCLPHEVLLMKDFILDEYQLFEGRANGADAALLIHAFLGVDKLNELYSKSLELGLTPLVEVHNEIELNDALKMQAQLIGINNRNLQSLAVDLDTSRFLSPARAEQLLDPHGRHQLKRIFISESGIENEFQIRELQSLGFDAFLMGTSLMKNKTPEKDLTQLLAAFK